LSGVPSTENAVTTLVAVSATHIVSSGPALAAIADMPSGSWKRSSEPFL
jgi:hypothetical protein